MAQGVDLPARMAELKAKARLRNAGPELLAALKLCVEWMPCAEVRNWPPGFEMRKTALAAARAAIAKAEGK